MGTCQAERTTGHRAVKRRVRELVVISVSGDRAGEEAAGGDGGRTLQGPAATYGHLDFHLGGNMATEVFSCRGE